MKHPVQRVKPDIHGRPRFVENAVVQYLLDNAYTKTGEKIDMNTLAMQQFPQEDRVQFAQLIGYSVDGFSTLSYVDEATLYAATHQSNANAAGDYHEKLVKMLRKKLRKPIAELFEIHPDDLDSN